MLAGVTYGITDRSKEAEEALFRTIALLEGEPVEQPGPVPEILALGKPTLLAQALFVLGMLYLDLDRAQDAENVLTRASGLFQSLVDSDPEDIETLSMFADLLDSLAEIYQDSDRSTEAEEVRVRLHAIRMHLAERNPDDPMNG